MVDLPPDETSVPEARLHTGGDARHVSSRARRVGSSALLIVAISAALIACYFLTGGTGFLIWESPPDSSFTPRAVRFAVFLTVAGVAATGLFFTRARPARPTVVATWTLAAIGLLYVAAIGWLLTAGFFGYGPLMPLTYAWVFTAHLLPAVAPTSVLVDLWRLHRTQSQGRPAPKVSIALVAAVIFGVTTLPFVYY